MAPEAVSPSERISNAIQKLIPAAAKLQNASEELSRPVAEVDAALKRLNLGVASWTTFQKQEDPDGEFLDWLVGYAQHAGRWALLVRQVEGNRTRPEDSNYETWFFNDAPRFIKPKAVDALPELIEGLVAVAEKTTGKLLKKVPDATALSAAVNKHFEKRK